MDPDGLWIDKRDQTGQRNHELRHISCHGHEKGEEALHKKGEY